MTASSQGKKETKQNKTNNSKQFEIDSAPAKPLCK